MMVMGGGGGVSCTLCGFIIVTQIPVTLQPLHHLLHLVVPISPKDNQATDNAREHQRNREAYPETPKFHILFKGEVDAHWDTDDIIGTNSREYRMSVSEWGFGEYLHEVKKGTGSLSTLRAQDTRDNGGQPIHELE